MDIDKTKNIYSFLWEKEGNISPPERYHFDRMQEAIPEKIVRGTWGIDIGSGCGYDTHIMAKNNPSIKIVSMDISDGIYKNLKLNNGLPNIYIVKGSVLNIPFKEGVFDFAYSFGVLHHIPNSQKGLSAIFRILKRKSPSFLYLYEDHSENIIKFIAIKIISAIRMITTKAPRKLLYALSLLTSPFVFLFFSLPAKILKKFESTAEFADKIPFNFGNSFFSLTGDLYDRFGAPIEHRFSRKEVRDLFESCHFSNISITRLKATAGWVAWGYKA